MTLWCLRLLSGDGLEHNRSLVTFKDEELTSWWSIIVTWSFLFLSVSRRVLVMKMYLWEIPFVY